MRIVRIRYIGTQTVLLLYFPLNIYQYPAIDHYEDTSCPNRPIDKPQLDVDWKECDLGHNHGRNTLIPGKMLSGICSTYLMTFSK